MDIRQLITLKVPPKTKVVAMITTWAVTYESTTTTEITVDMTHVLPVHYRTQLGFTSAREYIYFNRCTRGT